MQNSKSMRPFLLRWLFTTIAVFVATKLTGISYSSLYALVAAALFLGILNAFVRPVLLLLSIPFILVTMGIFIFVLNALLLGFVGLIIPGFSVPSFTSAFFGSIVVSIVSWVLSCIFKTSDGKIHVLTHHGQIASESMKQAQAKVVE